MFIFQEIMYNYLVIKANIKKLSLMIGEKAGFAPRTWKKYIKQVHRYSEQHFDILVRWKFQTEWVESICNHQLHLWSEKTTAQIKSYSAELDLSSPGTVTVGLEVFLFEIGIRKIANSVEKNYPQKHFFWWWISGLQKDKNFDRVR